MSDLTLRLRTEADHHRRFVLDGRKPGEEVKYAVRVMRHLMDLLDEAADTIDFLERVHR